MPMLYWLWEIAQKRLGILEERQGLVNWASAGRSPVLGARAGLHGP